MKRKAKICITLMFLISTLLSLMVSVNAASGAFDTQNFTGGDNFGGAATDTTWAARKATGTRFIIELDDDEVGGSNSYKYYVNYMQNKNQTDSALSVGSMYHGGYLDSDCYWTGGTIDTSGMTAAKMVTNFDTKATQYVDDPPSDSGNWFNNWRTTGSINLNITESGTKFLAKVIAASALDQKDTDTYNKMKSIVEDTYSGKLAVKAEIVFSLRTPVDKENVLITYNEFRRIANDGEHGGGVRWARGGSETTDGAGLDKIASKLYENDSEYALKNNEVNCSCNFLGSNSFTYDGKYLCYTGYSGSETITNTNVSDRKLPNICTMAVLHSNATRYYGAGLRDVNGTTVGSNIKVNGAKPANTDWSYRCPGSDIVSNTGMKANSYLSPVIFEGWDYIFVAAYTAKERWVDENGNDISGYSTKITGPIKAGTSHTFIGNRSIDGYTYTGTSIMRNQDNESEEWSDSTWNNTKKITVNNNVELIHKYKKNEEKTYTITEAWVEYGTDTALKTGETIKKKAGESYSFKGHTAYTSTLYTYKSTRTTSNLEYHTWNASTEGTITVSGDFNVIHYFEKKEFTITEAWVEYGTDATLKTGETTIKKVGESYTFKGPNEYSSSEYTYKSSKTTKNSNYHEWNSATESQITVTSDYNVIHYYEKVYTVTEKYMLKGTSTEIDSQLITPMVAGGMYYVTIKSIPNFEYDSSSPAGKSHTITSNKEIIHYYTIPTTPPPTELIYAKPTVTKTAEWTNDEKTEAEITITVQAEVEGLGDGTKNKIESADIIYLLDKSYSMGNEVNTSYANVRNAIADKLNYYLTGQYAGAGNRIGFATFSSNLYTYGNASTVVDEHYGRIRTCYNRPSGSKLTSVNALTYPQAKDRIFSNLDTRANPSVPKKYTARFYTTANDITNVISGLKKHGDGENTNFDLPLFYAQWLLENRSSAEQSRKSYVIFITEGQPYPDTDYARKQQGAKDARNSDYVANKFYAQIAADLRNTYDTEIYAIILERDKANSAMWETICGDSSHVFYTPDTQADAVKAIEKIHEKIAFKMEEEVTVEYADAAPMSLTDMINTDYFEAISTDASRTCTANIGSTSISNNKVYWNLGTVAYNKKCPDGQWPTLKIKIKLKDENTVGHLNTNYRVPTDDQCILTYPDGTVKKPTPWLDRESLNRTVTIKHIDDERKTTIDTETYSNILKDTYWPATGKIRNYAITNPQGQWGTRYKGYYLDTTNIVVNGTKYTSLESLPNSIFMNGDKVIEFHYKLKPAQLTIRYIEFKKKDGNLSPEFKTVDGGIKEIKVEKEQSIKVTKPSNFGGKSLYTGYNLSKTGVPILSERILNNLSSPTSPIKVKLNAEDTGAHLDIIYVEENYTLTVKYQDLDGNTIKEDVHKSYPPNTSVDLEDVEFETKIIFDGAEYLYKTRDDGKTGTDPIVMDRPGKVVIFKYEVQKVPVTIRFKDKDSREEIATPQTEYVKPGETVTVDESGIPGGYIYDSRDDGKDRDDVVGPVTGTTEVIFWYVNKVPVTVRFVDAITDLDIATAQTADVKIGETLAVDYGRVPSKYAYISRTDGKPNESDSVGPVYEGTEVILYYWIEEPVEGSGLPVVSYPYLSDVKEKDGKKYVVVGESLKVSIPNRFADRHEQAEGELIPLGWVKPTNGWNEEYAKVKYLVCECDVYRGNQLIPAGTPIKLDNAKGTATLELLIPEWVPEKEYKIEAIVGSEDKELTGLNYTTDTNYKENHIYNENAALGTVYITVIGRVYDFTVTNLVEDKYWEGSLFDPDVDGVNYKANLNPTDPKIGVLPIGQGPNGGNTDKQQAQKYNHGIALGSTFFFNVNTLGKKNQTVSIKPTFKYVPIDSTEVKDVDLYIETEDGKYENILETDGQVIQTQLNNDYKKENTSLGLEMSYAFGIGNGVVEFKDLKTNASYDLVTGSRLRLDKDNARVPFKEYFEEEGITRYAEGSKEYDEVLASACHWYGEYRIPSSTKVMAKGEEPGKGTEYKNGFIIVLFEIITQDVDDETVPHDDATHRYLIYNEQISGDQWDNEGGAAHGETMKLTMPRLTGVGTKEVNLTVANGTYPVAIYDVAVRANGKYEAAGTH